MSYCCTVRAPVTTQMGHPSMLLAHPPHTLPCLSPPLSCAPARALRSAARAAAGAAAPVASRVLPPSQLPLPRPPPPSCLPLWLPLAARLRLMLRLQLLLQSHVLLPCRRLLGRPNRPPKPGAAAGAAAPPLARLPAAVTRPALLLRSCGAASKRPGRLALLESRPRRPMPPHPLTSDQTAAAATGSAPANAAPRHGMSCSARWLSVAGRAPPGRAAAGAPPC